MLVVWRLLTARFAHPRENAFTGEGARLCGGRWNRKGVAMVYTAGSRSLATLEMPVQDEPLRARYVMSFPKIETGGPQDFITDPRLMSR
jgi:RES domain-containing protein